MINESRECPFCGRLLRVMETTNREHSDAGLVYLKVKCSTCWSQIESAGRGEGEALLQLDKKLERRKGTKPEMWEIRPVKKYRRRR